MTALQTFFPTESDKEKDATKSNEQVPEQAEGKPVERGEIPSLISEQNGDKTRAEQTSKTPMKDRCHKLWLPTKQPNLAELVFSLQNTSSKKDQKSPLQWSESKLSLRSRQQLLNNRIHVTQAVLPDEILNKLPRKKMTFKDAAERVIASRRNNLQVSDVVSQYLAKMKAEGVINVAASIRDFGGVMKSNNFPSMTQRRRYDAQISNVQGGKHGSLPLETWHTIVKQTSVSLDDDCTEESLETLYM